MRRQDDTMAAFSSRGPTMYDYLAKPDLVAPGFGTVSLADPLSAFYTTKAQFLLRRPAVARLHAVSHAERHQHGGAGRGRHRRADAAGQSRR